MTGWLEAKKVCVFSRGMLGQFPGKEGAVGEVRLGRALLTPERTGRALEMPT